MSASTCATARQTMAVRQWPADYKYGIRPRMDRYSGPYVSRETPGPSSSRPLLPRGLGPSKDRYRSSTHVGPRLYFTTNAGCRGGQSRGQPRLTFAVPIDAASQLKMTGSMQEEIRRDKGAHSRFSSATTSRRQGSSIPSALSELRPAIGTNERGG